MRLDILREVSQLERVEGGFGRSEMKAIADRHSVEYLAVKTEFYGLWDKGLLAGMSLFGCRLRSTCRLTEAGIQETARLDSRRTASPDAQSSDGTSESEPSR